MYKIESENFGRFTKVKLINPETGEYAAIIPDFGGNVNELVLQKNNKNYTIVQGNQTGEDINEGFKGAKLAPFANRINKGKYNFNAHSYQLPINHGKHSIHGLVYNKAFTIVGQKANEEEAAIELEYAYNRDDDGFPFKFKLNIIYSFSEDHGFTTTTKIENLDKEEFPMGDGWHLYFKTSSRIDECLFKIPSSVMVLVDDDMIPNGKLKSVNKYQHFAKIENDTFDTCYILPGKKSIVAAEIYDIIEDIRIVAWQETGNKKYNYMQIYTPGSRDCIAIEPMTSQPDTFNNQQGLIVLKPGEIFEASCGVKLS